MKLKSDLECICPSFLISSNVTMHWYITNAKKCTFSVIVYIGSSL